MRYIVTKPFRPKGSNNPEVQVDTELELGTDQARLFKALGWVKDAPAPAPSVQVAPIQWDEAGEVVAERHQTKPARAKRTYKTRQLKAEE